MKNKYDFVKKYLGHSGVTIYGNKSKFVKIGGVKICDLNEQTERWFAENNNWVKTLFTQEKNKYTNSIEKSILRHYGWFVKDESYNEDEEDYYFHRVIFENKKTGMSVELDVPLGKRNYDVLIEEYIEKYRF